MAIPPTGVSPTTLRAMLHDAIRCWEPRRIPYNLVLVAVVIAWVICTWPHFRPAFTLQSLVPLAALAAIANACYCAAYFADLAMQRSSIASAWRRWRVSLWLAGTLFAVVLACYWIADEIYPYVS